MRFRYFPGENLIFPAENRGAEGCTLRAAGHHDVDMCAGEQYPYLGRKASVRYSRNFRTVKLNIFNKSFDNI